jgi:hypothetical protein
VLLFRYSCRVPFGELPLDTSVTDNPIVDPWNRPREPVKDRKLASSIGIVALGLVSVLAPLTAVGFLIYKAPEIPGTVSSAWSSIFSGEEKKKKQQTLHLHDDVEKKHDFDEPGTIDAPLPIPHEPQNPQGSVPKKTAAKHVGQVDVVTIGSAEASLRGALAEQAKQAKTHDKQILVMTVDDGCKPCEGFLKSVDTPLMQEALAPMVVVIVDTNVFTEELKQLKMETTTKPWFYLVSSDFSPRDGINGGEWGEDIAENIAPVMGPFVRGQYKNRKNPFKPQPGGVFL